MNSKENFVKKKNDKQFRYILYNNGWLFYFYHFILMNNNE